MSEEEVQEALKIIKEPITVNSIEYKYFDQENYEKLLRVYENYRWFINIHEQVIQNLDNLHQELDQYKNNWEELKKWLNYEWYEMSNDINCGDILNKMKELEEDK